MKRLTWSDARLSLRLMARAPGLTMLSVLSLGVGTGLATAAFTVVNGVFLKPLPVPDGHRIVKLWDFHRAGRYNIYVSAAEFERRARATTSYSHLAAYYTQTLPLESPGYGARVARGAFVTPDAFAMLGARAAMGRALVAADLASGAPPVVVIGDDVWRTQFASDPGIVGRLVRVGREWRTVVGVLPPGLRFPERESFWVPLQPSASNAGARLYLAGKLLPGVSLEQAEAELNVIGLADDAQRYQPGDVVQRVLPFTRGGSGSGEVTIVGALVAVLVLLLIVAAANVANLMLARNAARARELAVRSALGAARARLLWHLWLETLVLTTLGALLGAVGARVALAWLSVAVTDLPWWSDFSFSRTVFGFIVLLALLAATVAGLAPALRVTRLPPVEVLRSGSPGVAGIGFGRLSTALIVAELAIAVGFLGGAATLGRGLLGFGYQRDALPAGQVLVAQLYFGQPSFPTGATREQRIAAWREFERTSDARRARIERDLAGVAGVRGATVGSTFPGNEVEPSRIDIEGSVSGGGAARVASVGAGYFELLDARVLAGRDFLPSEYVETPAVALVNEPFARRHFAGRSPLGARIRVTSLAGDAHRWLEVVGVVPDLGLNPGDASRAEGVYLPQGPTNVLRLGIRSEGDPRALVPAVHDVVLRAAPDAQVQWTATMEEQMREVASIFRGLGMALLAMGLVALLLSAASIFAIVTLSVTQRTREMGIRLALGATSLDLLRSILERPARQSLLGAVLGIGVGATVIQLVKVIPFDIQPGGPLIVAAFMAFMVAATLAATIIPARRTLRIQPATAIRQE